MDFSTDKEPKYFAVEWVDTKENGKMAKPKATVYASLVTEIDTKGSIELTSVMDMDGTNGPMAIVSKENRRMGVSVEVVLNNWRMETFSRVNGQKTRRMAAA